MPYYCTVPRCTSMAGKVKNVSFHQFPRDEELAQLWNEILKRGKPYTKYSKVCSLHFKPEDYTVTSVGKNKGQWRTLRKDAIPSRNLPTDSPTGHHRSRNSKSWSPASLPPNLLDSQMHQQMAQAIYMQTMLAMQVAGEGLNSLPSPQNSDSPLNSKTIQEPSAEKSLSEYEKFLIARQLVATPSSPESVNTLDGSENTPSGHCRTGESENAKNNGEIDCDEIINNNNKSSKLKTDDGRWQTDGGKSFKCDECSKCFKDPDVFILHRRTHRKKPLSNGSFDTITSQNGNIEKENLNINSSNNQDKIRDETIKANPILANLLKSGMTQSRNGNVSVNPDTNIICSLENQIMATIATNMEAYFRNLASMMANSNFRNGESVQEASDSEIEEDCSEQSEALIGDVSDSVNTKEDQLSESFQDNDANYLKSKYSCINDNSTQDKNDNSKSIQEDQSLSLTSMKKKENSDEVMEQEGIDKFQSLAVIAKT